MKREAYIIAGVVSEAATKLRAEDRYRTNGELTKIHYHSATSGSCNDRCVEWPPISSV